MANPQQIQNPFAAFSGLGSNTGSSNLFGGGATTGGTSLFGSNAGTTNTANTAAGASPFATLGTGTAGNTPSAPKPGLFSGSNLFGGTPGAGSTTGIFGAQGASSTPSANTPGALFGNTTSAPGGGLFGTTPKPAENTTGSAPVPSLFGANNPGASSTSQTAAPSVFSGFGRLGATPSLTLTQAPGPGAAPPATAGNTNAPTATGSSIFANLGKPPTPAPPTLGGGLFGNFGASKESTEKKDGATPTPGAPAAPTPGLPTLAQPQATPGLFSLPKPPSVSPNPGATSSAPTFNLFGALPNKDQNKDDKEKDAAKPPSAQPTTLNFGLGKPPASTPSAAQPTTGADAPKALTTTTTPAPPTTTAPPAPKPLPPSILKGKTIEEIINQWNSDLETQVKEFHRYANELSVWDKTLIDNANQIASLYATVLAAEQTQEEVEQSLNHIEDNQGQLLQVLDDYDQKIIQLLEGQGDSRNLNSTPADAERDHNYALATSLNAQLDDLARSLTSIIDEVNSVTMPSTTNAGSSDNTDSTSARPEITPDDPMTQIQAILNAHLDSLTWLNSSVRDVETRVRDLEGRYGVGGGDERAGGPQQSTYGGYSSNLGSSSYGAPLGRGQSSLLGKSKQGQGTSSYGLKW